MLSFNDDYDNDTKNDESKLWDSLDDRQLSAVPF